MLLIQFAGNRKRLHVVLSLMTGSLFGLTLRTARCRAQHCLWRMVLPGQRFEVSLDVQRAVAQDHLYRSLVGETADQHGAVGDAMKSMHLCHLYKHLEKDVDKHREALVF